MQISAIPSKYQFFWAQNANPANVSTIPNTTATAGRASLSLGFPPINFTPVNAGGIPPFGQDQNGSLQQITQWLQWYNAGGPVSYDGTFSAAVGGYPQGAMVSSATSLGLFWLSLVDNNTSNPDTGGAGWQAAGIAAPATGAQLQCSGAAQASVKIVPANGGMLWINGVNYQLPSGGVTLNNTGLSASTFYYVYAYMNAGTMTLEASATGYTAASNGMPQKTGAVTRTLVGSVFTDASVNFNDTSVLRNVASFFNRKNKTFTGAGSNQVAVNSATPVEVSAASRAEAITWGDEGTSLTVYGSAFYVSNATAPSSTVGVDGVTQGAGGNGVLNSSISTCGQIASYATTLADGHHVFSPFAYSTTPTASANWSLFVQGLVRS